jgi:hypothetical protein
MRGRFGTESPDGTAFLDVLPRLQAGFSAASKPARSLPMKRGGLEPATSTICP